MDAIRAGGDVDDRVEPSGRVLQPHHVADPVLARYAWAAALPSITAAVATVTAASTPIEVCTRCGMNMRVARLPPAAGGATRHIFGTVVVATSPSPIRTRP